MQRSLPALRSLMIDLTGGRVVRTMTRSTVSFMMSDSWLNESAAAIFATQSVDMSGFWASRRPSALVYSEFGIIRVKA